MHGIELLVFVIGMSLVVVAIAVGLDVGTQAWVERVLREEAEEAEKREALSVLSTKLKERYNWDDTIPMKVVSDTKYVGRHRAAA